jgi:hypothetical protein
MSAHPQELRSVDPRQITSLASKLVDVALDIGAIEKDGYNQAQRYAFTSADNVVGAIRRKLFDKRVLLLATEERTEERLRQTSKGGETAITTVHKLFLRQQFLIPWGNDDIEADEGSDARAGVPGARETVDLIAKARGMSNAVLNEALVAGGLPAQQGNPFATFMRIPAESAEAVEAYLDGHREP